MFCIDSTLYKYIVLSNTIEHLLNCVRRVRPYILHFTTLRTDGGFLVSAATTGGGVPKDVEVTSLAGRRCSVLLPKGWTSIVVRKAAAGGTAAEPVLAGVERRGFGLAAPTKLFHFETVAGGRYELADGAMVPGAR